MDEKKSSALRQTLFVLIGLAVLTAIEYVVGQLEAATIALFIISLFKAGLILNYFMQVSGLWARERH